MATKYTKIVDGSVLVAKIEMALTQAQQGRKPSEDPLEMLAALDPA